MVLEIVADAFAGIAAALHVVFFLFESVLLARPSVQKRFQLAPEHADAVRPWAFNQGFYNLFLAAGIVAGLLLRSSVLVAFVCACMFGAGLVLAASNRRMLRAAAIQALPPFVVLVLLAAR